MRNTNFGSSQRARQVKIVSDSKTTHPGPPSEPTSRSALPNFALRYLSYYNTTQHRSLAHPLLEYSLAEPTFGTLSLILVLKAPQGCTASPTMRLRGTFHTLHIGQVQRHASSPNSSQVIP
ncbi:hypothetical protein CVT26_000933 [Gymnopilus dilepis]|uniref:Uncharacterized protein n=1 Tax=Gymnopilus dilepis TaxID=231916 RepID=A0A409WYR0_9AGAR|nr:hypothetical protein CVT26_000933 [Gymnopilus dilepis]